MLFPNATSVVNLRITIPTASTAAAIFYLSSVMTVQRRMKVVAAKNAWTSSTCRKKSKKKEERESTKEEISLTSQDKGSGQNSIIPVMNKLLWFSLFILVYSCGNIDGRNPQTVSAKTEYRGLIIDPSVKNKAASKNRDTSIFSLAAIDINVFENDKPVDRRVITALPCYAMAQYRDDTLSILINPMLGVSFAFYIQKYRDSCWVSHVFSLHEERTGPYKLHARDSVTKPGLIVHCRFTVILDKTEYKDKESVYGFVEGRSDDYYRKTDSVDTKARVEFKGYFRAPAIDRSPSIQ